MSYAGFDICNDYFHNYKFKRSLFVRMKQALVLDLYTKFKSICEAEGIIYWAYGGSLIGAIRHSGFVPWDDDMDLMIPRKDYQKLINIISKRKDLKLIAAGNHQYHYYKLFDDSTVFIDLVFAEEYYASSYKESNDLFLDLYHRKIMDLKKEYTRSEKINYLELLRTPYIYMTSGKKHFIGIGIESAIKGNEKLNSMDYDRTFPLQKIKFDNTEMYVPRDYEYWLNTQFGCYAIPALYGLHDWTRIRCTLDTAKKAILKKDIIMDLEADFDLDKEYNDMSENFNKYVISIENKNLESKDISYRIQMQNGNEDIYKSALQFYYSNYEYHDEFLNQITKIVTNSPKLVNVLEDHIENMPPIVQFYFYRDKCISNPTNRTQALYNMENNAINRELQCDLLKIKYKYKIINADDVALCKRMASMGWHQSMAILAELYQNKNNLVRYNVKTACDWYLKAYKLSRNYALSCFKTIVDNKLVEKMPEFISIGKGYVECNHAESIFLLGITYQNGFGIDKCEEDASLLLEKISNRHFKKEIYEYENKIKKYQTEV